MSKLLRFKEWLTIPDAARYLSGFCGEPVDEADVLRLGLDGHLKLSVYFVNHAYLRRGTTVTVDQAEARIFPRDPNRQFNKLLQSLPPVRIDHDSEKLPAEIAEGLRDGSLVYCITDLEIREGQFLHLEKKVVSVSGVWDLPLIGAEALDVEHRCQQLIGGPDVTLETIDGAFVESTDGAVCQLQERLDSKEMREIQQRVLDELRERGVSKELKLHTPKEDFYDARNFFPAGGLPADCILVVRPSALTGLQESLASPNAKKRRNSGGTLSPRAVTAYDNTIGALLKLLLAKDARGRASFPSEAAIISAIQSEYPRKHGLSERELQEKFAEAKRTLRST